MLQEARRFKPAAARRRMPHVSTKIREAIRGGLFDQTEEHKAGHLAKTPTDNCPRRTERAVLLELADYAGKDGRMCPAVDTLAADLEMGERTVRRAINCLRARGILLCIMQGGRSRGEGEYSGASVFLLNSQLIERLFGERRARTLPLVKLTDKPGGLLLENNTPTDTTVEGGGCGSFDDGDDDDLDDIKQTQAKPQRQPQRQRSTAPILYKQTRPSRWKHTWEDVMRALVGAGCDKDRAAVWFKYARFNRQTELYAPRFGFDDIRADAAEWFSRDRSRDRSKPMTYAEMRAHAEKNHRTIVADYVQLDGNLWLPKPKAKA